MLDVERFIAKYPEIEHVSWYGTDGRVLLSLGGDGTTRERRAPARRRGDAELAARAGIEPPYLLTQNVSPGQRYRLSGPIWTESFADDALFSADPAAAEAAVRAARLRQRGSRFLGVRERALAAPRGRERGAVALARRVVGIRPLVLEERARAAVGARALAGADRSRRLRGAVSRAHRIRSCARSSRRSRTRRAPCKNASAACYISRTTTSSRASRIAIASSKS